MQQGIEMQTETEIGDVPTALVRRSDPPSLVNRPSGGLPAFLRTGPMQEWGRLFGLALPHRWKLAAAIVCMIGSSLTSLALSVVVQNLIDSIFEKHDGNALNVVTLALLAVFLVQAFFTVGQNYLIYTTGERVMADLRRRLYDHMLRLSVSYYNEHRTGELMSRLNNDVTLVQNAVTGNLLALLQNSFLLLGALVMVLILSWQLTGIILLVLPVIVLVALRLGRAQKQYSREAQEELGNAGTIADETIGGVRTVKGFTREEYEVARFSAAIERSFRIAVQRVRLSSAMSGIMSFLIFGAIAIVLWVGGQQVLSGKLTSGQLVQFLILMGIVGGQVAGLSGLYSQFQQSLGGAARVFEVLETSPVIEDKPQASALPPVDGHLRFENVTFAYEDDAETPILANVSFEAKPGCVVAVVGPSGAGKTTIASLIPRFFDPVGGRITLDGHDIAAVQQRSLREQIGLVPQEPVLFGLSIRENIRYGRLDATDDEIAIAAHAANAEEFIAHLPDGYDTLVGERGVKLSGGQRQRIAIARAILRDPRILVLDEATSSLDNESEALVQEALDRLMRDRTTVVIAHRLTTIEKADTIVVLEHGHIIERGTHADLLALEGLYHRLYTRSFEAGHKALQSA